MPTTARTNARPANRPRRKVWKRGRATGVRRRSAPPGPPGRPAQDACWSASGLLLCPHQTAGGRGAFMRGSLVGLFTIALLPGVFAQSQFATLNGTVRDATGAVVPGVQLRLMNAETGEAWQATANDHGNYTIPLVKPGEHYQLDADRPGFRAFRQTDIVMETGGQHRIDIMLEVGAQTERVVVEATAPQLRSETSAVGVVIDNRTIVNMPLINRRAAQLARLQGFVVQNGTGSNFTMAGGRGNNANWQIDGANAQNVLLGVQTLSFDPPIEALQEFNVSISNYAAELGRT